MNHTVKQKTRPLTALAPILLLLSFALLIVYGKTLGEAAYDSLAFAATKLIPSMFLFAVFAKIAAAIPTPQGRRPLPLLRLPPSALTALFIGLLSGFPMGAYAAKSLYDHGALSEKQAAHLAAYANNASLAFLLFTVSPLFGNRAVGWLLFASGTLASLLVGILLAPKESPPTLPHIPRTPPLFSLICNATVSASQAMLTLAGYLTLFGTLAKALLMTKLPKALITALLLFLEPTAALRHLATLSTPNTLPLAAFALGFSGLSILMQSMTVWQNRLSLTRLVAIRLLIGILSASFTMLFSAIFVGHF